MCDKSDDDRECKNVEKKEVAQSVEHTFIRSCSRLIFMNVSIVVLFLLSFNAYLMLCFVD